MNAMRSKYFFTLILLLFFVFWIWWIPGLRVANDFSLVSNDWLKLQFDIPRAWNERGAEGLGEYGVFILWSYPINFIFGVSANLGLNFEVWERILVLLFIFLGSISIWKLLSTYRLSDKSKLIGSLFYLINTYSILLIDGGQLSIALSYGLFPLAYLLISEAVHSGMRKKIIAGLVISILSFFDIRFLYILFLLLIFRALFDILEGQKNRLKILWRWIITGFAAGLVVLVLNSFWLIAILKTPIDKGILSSFTKISANLFSIGHPILVISPHWYKNVFGWISQLKSEFILLPILILLAPILRRKDKNTLFWLLVAIFSIFLAKGGSEPLPQIYPWLHANIPGFYLFRDSTKFFFLLILSYSVLIAFTSEVILKRLPKKLAVIYLIAVIGYFLYLIRPVFLGQMTGTFSVQPAENDFRLLSNILKEDKEFGRVFWIPTTAPLSYSDLNHPIVEAARVFNRLPFVYGVKGSYETYNFLREAPYMGEIFDVAGISYIAYPQFDLRRSYLSPDDVRYYYSFLNQLINLPWVEGKIAQSKVPLLKTKNHQDKIFITDRSFAVFGSDEIFYEATKSANLKLSKNAIIFMEDKPGMGQLISRYPEVKIVLNNKTGSDITASFIPESKMIFPAKQLTVKPDKTGWWKNDGTDLISWRDFLQSKYGIDNNDFDLGGGWAVGEGNLKLEIRDLKLEKNKILLARVMESSRSGVLKFYQRNQEVGEISTAHKENANARWFEIGLLSETGDLTIKAVGDINIINALAVINPQDLKEYNKKSDDLGRQVTDFRAENVSEDNPSVVYQKINQTEYKIIVSNLTQPEIVVFSSTYHHGWKLNGKSAIPVYGFLNGFRVERNGEFIITFEPQNDVKYGLIISGIALVLLLGFLFVKHL